MTIIKQAAMEMAYRGVPLVVDAVQCDGNTRALKLQLTENGQNWTIPGGVSPGVSYRKPDGTAGLYDKLPDGSPAVTVSGSTVTAVFAPQMLTAAGRVAAAVVFLDGGLNRLATFPFTVNVAANPGAAAAVSRDYYRYQTMADVNAALEEMERELLLSAAPAITGEAVGRALRLEDSAERRFPELGVLGWCGLNGVPAPESPAEMAAAGTEGSVTVQAGGRNLCDFQQWRTMTTIVNGGTMTTTDRSATLTATAGECYSMYTEGHTLKIPAAPNTKYTLSWKAAGTAGSVYVFCNASAEAGHLFEAGGTRGALTFTTTADTRFLTFRLGVSGVGNTVTYSEIMLNIGEKAEYLPYAPVTGAKLSTPGGLLGIPVPSGGNVADETGQRWICDEIVGEKLVRRCRKVAFDGTEAWSQNSANHFLTTVLSPMPAGAVLCTHLPYLRDYVGNGCYCDGPVLVVGGSVGAGYTVERWKAFLAGEAARGTPVTAVYALASPVETELAAGEAAAMAALRTQRAETSLHCTDDAWARAQYIMDTRLYIDRKFRELAAAVVVSGE